MSILTINAGSSSLRFTLFSEDLETLFKGHIDAIGQKHCQFRRYFEDGAEEQEQIQAKDHHEAIAHALTRLKQNNANLKITKVAHRVVHGGEGFKEPTYLNPTNLKKLQKLSSLAPLHNPANLSAISACRRRLPKAKHYAIFDTAFHATLAEKAYLYGLPYSLYKKEGIRRYGFHGTSHKYVALEAERLLGSKKSAKHALITCHIGNGISLAAIKNGVCLDTTMGFTPLEGPMMGTRSGSIDPAIIFHLAKSEKSTKKEIVLEKIHNLLEKESGFKGLSEISSDIRELWARPKSKGTQRSFKVFSYQMAKHIMMMTVALNQNPDAIVFTAGIGTHAYYLREMICEQLNVLGVKLSKAANQKNQSIISSPSSKVKVLVIPTNESLQMAREIQF